MKPLFRAKRALRPIFRRQRRVRRLDAALSSLTALAYSLRIDIRFGSDGVDRPGADIRHRGLNALLGRCVHDLFLQALHENKV